MADFEHGRTYTMTAFERGRGRSRNEKKDDKITVAVHVTGRGEDGRYAKGNIARGLTVRNAKVSEVFDVIEAALFGETL